MRPSWAGLRGRDPVQCDLHFRSHGPFLAQAARRHRRGLSQFGGILVVQVSLASVGLILPPATRSNSHPCGYWHGVAENSELWWVLIA